MASIPLVAGAVLVVAGATSLAAGFGAFDEWAGDMPECAWHLGTPHPGADAATVRFTINNSVEPFPVRVCAFDANGLERVDRTFEVPVAAAHVVELPVPSGPFDLVVEYAGPGADRAAQLLAVDPKGCPDGVVAVDLRVGLSFGHPWYRVPVPACAATGDAADGAAVLGGTAPFSGPPGLGVGAVLSVAGVMTLALANAQAIVFGAVTLYSRLERPRVLDHPTRGRIVDLVTHRPGIRFHDVARTLGLGQGQAIHHLRTLVDRGVLCRVRRAYFVAGRHGPAEMRAVAALGSETARAMLEAVSSAREARLGDLAERMGVTTSWAGKVAKRLERAGLVVRRLEGRACRVAIVERDP